MTEERKRPVFLPPSELTVGRSQKAFPVLHRDWRRVRRGLVELLEPMPLYREAAWGCAAIAFSALLGWIGWGPIYAGMSNDQKLANAAQGPFMVVAAVAFTIGAIVFGLADRALRARTRTTAESLVTDMDEIYQSIEGELPPGADRV